MHKRSFVSISVTAGVLCELGPCDSFSVCYEKVILTNDFFNRILTLQVGMLQSGFLVQYLPITTSQSANPDREVVLTQANGLSVARFCFKH